MAVASESAKIFPHQNFALYTVYGRQLSMSTNSRHFDVISTSKILSKKAWHHFKILEGFNRQWQKEYLSLRENYNVKKQKEKSAAVLAPGDVVLVKEERTARCWWQRLSS